MQERFLKAALDILFVSTGGLPKFNDAQEAENIFEVLNLKIVIP